MIDGKRVISILPCRLFSTRLFAKQLQLIGNKTILQSLIEQLKTSRVLDGIILAVSEKIGNDVFIEYAKEYGVDIIQGNEEDVLGRILTAVHQSNADIVLRMTAENPFIYWEGIDPLIQKHIDNKYDLSYYGELPIGSAYEIIEPRALEYAYIHGNLMHKGELSTLYIYENPDKFRIQRIELDSLLRRPEIRLTVDTPEDLIVARLINDNLKINKKPISLISIINFLDKHPDIKKINSKISIKYKKFM